MSIVELFGLKFEEGFITVVKHLKGCCLATLHSEGRAVERNRGSFHLLRAFRGEIGIVIKNQGVRESNLERWAIARRSRI